MQVEVVRMAPDKLSGETWRFVLPHHTGPTAILLDGYRAWDRQSPRHKPRPKPGRIYGRVFDSAWREDCRFGRPWVPPMPEDVVAEARAKMAELLLAAPVDAPTMADAEKAAKDRRYG